MEQIAIQLKAVGVPYKVDAATIGGGNSFFASLEQQCQRPQMEMDKWHHTDLRKAICRFALESGNSKLVEYKRRYYFIATECGLVHWDSVFSGMKAYGAWTEEPVVQVAAWFLKRDILVVSPGSTIDNPYLHVHGAENDCKDLALLLWNTGRHYQSLLLEEQLNVATTTSSTVQQIAPPGASTSTTHERASSSSSISKSLKRKRDTWEPTPLKTMDAFVADAHKRHINLDGRLAGALSPAYMQEIVAGQKKTEEDMAAMREAYRKLLGQYKTLHWGVEAKRKEQQQQDCDVSLTQLGRSDDWSEELSTDSRK